MTGNRRTVTLAWLASASLCACGSSDDSQSPPVLRLFINELQPSNQDTITDERGEADDWIELVNLGDAPVDMLGFSLADTSGTTQVIPSSVVVPPGAFHLLWADDSPDQGASHLGFKLSGKAGDSVVLMDKNGRTIDSVSFGPTTGQNSYARFPDGTGSFAWCRAPTPGSSNGAACEAP